MIDNSKKIILHLCASEFGSDTKDYRDAGYDVRLITKDIDVRTYKPPQNVYGVIANPPCTHFAGSGARWWKKKGDEALYEGLALVDACMRIILISKPKFWVLENPVGRLTRYLGVPKMYFNPCDYGDDYTKKTALWGDFNPPKKHYRKPIKGSKMHLLPPSSNRADLRSIASPYFTKAFFEANK